MAALALLVFAGGCLTWSYKVKRYGLDTAGPFHEGTVNLGGGEAPFAYDKWFEVRNVFLPEWIFGPRQPTPGAAKGGEADQTHYAAEDNLLDCMRPGTETYAVLFRSYVYAGPEGTPLGATFYALVKVDRTGRPDARKSIVSRSFPAEPGANEVLIPRAIEMGADRLRIELEPQKGDGSPGTLEAQGRRDLAFGLQDFRRRRDQVHAQAGDERPQWACRALENATPKAAR